MNGVYIYLATRNLRKNKSAISEETTTEPEKETKEPEEETTELEKEKEQER